MSESVPHPRLALLPCIGALVLSAAGCAPASDATPAAAPGRQDLRERLRQELGDGYDAAIPAATPVEVIRGAEIYEVLCSGCHGPQGQGDGPAGRRLGAPPPRFSRGFFSDRATLEIIRRGVPGTPMIGWGNMLDEEELLQVFQHVRSLSGADGGAEDRR
jgi:mono/diheme cytochrome c family protein